MIRITSREWSIRPENEMAVALGLAFASQSVLEDIIKKSKEKGIEVPEFVESSKEIIAAYGIPKRCYYSFVSYEGKELFEVKVTKKKVEWYVPTKI